MIEIAIDGTAASGKGTLAKKLAKKYGFVHLDTGLLYRKVACELMDQRVRSLWASMVAKLAVDLIKIKINLPDSEKI